MNTADASTHQFNTNSPTLTTQTVAYTRTFLFTFDATKKQREIYANLTFDLESTVSSTRFACNSIHTRHNRFLDFFLMNLLEANAISMEFLKTWIFLQETNHIAVISMESCFGLAWLCLNMVNSMLMMRMTFFTFFWKKLHKFKEKSILFSFFFQIFLFIYSIWIGFSKSPQWQRRIGWMETPTTSCVFERINEALNVCGALFETMSLVKHF